MEIAEIHKQISTEFEGHLDKYQPDVVFQCIHCSFECHSALDILFHLNDKHNFVINKLSSLALLDVYLLYWKTHLPPIEKAEAYGHIKDTISVTDESEKQLRSHLHKIRLERIMERHEYERTVVQNSIPCLFCNKTFTGTWHEYLQWLFEQHSFNPGRPANLVFIEDLITHLRSLMSKKICFHCYQQFPNEQLMISHMKKKPNTKIPMESRYDRYYMVNYLEEDRKWAEVIAENDDEIDETLEEGVKDFDDVEINETSCLICDAVLTDPEGAIQHMKSFHDFDFAEIREVTGRDFYKLVRFVNYARTMRQMNKCFVCGAQVLGEYESHIFSHQKKTPIDLNHLINL